MSYKVDSRRYATMRQRIGVASDLVKSDQWLPFYRGVQIKLEKLGKADEWARMVETSLTKSDPSRYFAKICKMVKDGTYRFVEKVKEITGSMAEHLSDKLLKFGFAKYHRYYVHKANEFINKNGMAGFVELLEYADRKAISQKYMARALMNCKAPREYYKQNVLGGK